MQREELHNLAQQLATGEITVERFMQAAQSPGTADLGEVTLDLDRAARCGFPEVVYGEGKSVDTIVSTLAALFDAGVDAMATRVDTQQGAVLTEHFASGRYNPRGRIFRLDQPVEKREMKGRVAVVTAGTTDRAVAEEAKETLDWMAVDVALVQDVCGMEGARPSVVGGHVSVPVIAVPTSVGYGANLGGLAALLSMLNSCAANVAVVNIDAGFKGGYLAGMIARTRG